MELPAPSRRRARPTAASPHWRAPSTRDVRSVPSAETSVGDARPVGVTSMPPTAKLTSSCTSAGERSGGGGVGQQGGQRRRGQRGRLQQRLGEPGPAHLLQHAHQVDVAQAQPVGRLGHDERRCAQLGQHGPAVLRLLGPGGLVRHVEGAQGIRRALGVEDDAHALTQCLLLLR